MQEVKVDGGSGPAFHARSEAALGGATRSAVGIAASRFRTRAEVERHRGLLQQAVQAGGRFDETTGEPESWHTPLCPWLIRRFIDPDAEFTFVPASKVLSVAEHEEAHSFDSPWATFTHDGNWCTFEVSIDRFGLTDDPALVRLARIVFHAQCLACPRLPGRWSFVKSPVSSL